MAYTPENNPYIPGDPYSYDLKWVVDEIEKWKTSEEAVQTATDQADRAEREADKAFDEANRAKDNADDAAASEASAKDYADHIADPVSGIVTSWLAAHITQPTTPAIDDTLTIQGAAADAASTGERIEELHKTIETNLINIYSTATPTSFWLDFDIKKGDAFRLTNKTKDTISLGAYAADQSTRYQQFTPISANGSGVVVINQDTPYLLVYTRNVGYVEIERLGSSIKKSPNLFDFNVKSELGEWCNYSNGNFESNAYVTTYYHSAFIPVKPATSYARRFGVRGTCFFDESGTFISGIRTDVFTTPVNCKYLILDITTQDSGYEQEMLVESANNLGSTFIPYFSEFSVPKPKRENIVVGTGGDYSTVHDGIVAAIAEDLPLIILPGEYDLVAEGINGNGYWLPRVTYGYGATLRCELVAEDWNLSPLNVHPARGAEVYGLTVIAENCRYCIHDEMGQYGGTPFYHNIFKDLHLIHKSAPSAILLTPQCIGGGLGDEGYIEIENCVFEAQIRDVSYHSMATTPQRDQTGNCIIKINDCYFNHMPTVAAIGTGTSYMNKMYVSNCSLGEAVTTTPQTNITLIAWNTPVR